MQRKDIIRAANSLVAVYGEKAETMVERKIAGCMKAGYNVMAGIWKEIRAAISELRRANEATMASSVGHAPPGGTRPDPHRTHRSPDGQFGPNGTTLQRE